MTALDAIPVYVDCDTGIDDALALAYLLAEPRVRIVGIGTVSGNVAADRAATNTIALLEAAGRVDIPVAIGEHHPIAGTFAGGAPHVHGHDGVGGFGLTAEHFAPDTRTAVELMTDLAHAHRRQLRVLALGPLTNLARFAESCPEEVEHVSRVIVMGGAFAHRGNVTPVAEANIHNDPEAAHRVFSTRWSIDVVPLDVTMHHVLTEADAHALAQVAGRIPAYLSRMLDTYLDFYADVYGVRQCALHDPLAAIIAADAITVTSADEPADVRVETQGEERGRTVSVATRYGEAGPHRSRRIVNGVAGSAFETLLDRVRSHNWPGRPPR
ncbi:nucleoside hydrolase [Microbacterium sp. RU33B]|uniref:nucleoside hydrolase n=1 Tax=Microbacterium sp. RU33B TaxID=1907390 RepID=UPI00095EB4AA|nr:nucleoside hydrolase [Microbacterium sp. RU33B]SIT68184.1 purine nucleosidase [Microbacterium sp. RU33B]